MEDSAHNENQSIGVGEGWALLLVLLASALLLLPAMINGFPLLSLESSFYIQSAVERQFDLLHYSMYYFFLSEALLLDSVWLPLMVSAALTTIVVSRFLALAGFRFEAFSVVVTILLLGLGTALPWQVSAVTPLFTSGLLLISLGAFLFLSKSFADVDWYLFGVSLFFGVVSDSSHFFLCLIIWFLVLTFCFRSLLKKALAVSFLIMLAGQTFLVGLSVYETEHFSVLPGNDSLLASRLIEQGPLQWYLQDECLSNPLVLCDTERQYVKRSARQLLELPGTKLYWKLPREERRAISQELNLSILAALQEYPLLALQMSLKNVWHAMTASEIEQFFPHFEELWGFLFPIRGLYPFKEKLNNRYSSFKLGKWKPRTAPPLFVVILQHGVFWFSLAAVLWGLFRLPELSDTVKQVSVMLLCAFFVNGLWQGLFANSLAGSGAQLRWLIPLLALLMFFTKRTAVEDGKEAIEL